jgi:hypothetical protein
MTALRRTRVIESTNGLQESDKWFVWCATELCEERDYSGAVVEKRFLGAGEQVLGTNYLFARDHLGSIREMTDTNNAVRARYEYDPCLFGIDLDKMLKDYVEKFTDDAKIELKSCGSANPLAPYTPAKAFKSNIPSAQVFGYTGLFLDIGPIELGAPNMKPFTGFNPFTTPGKRL